MTVKDNAAVGRIMNLNQEATNHKVDTGARDMQEIFYASSIGKSIFFSVFGVQNLSGITLCNVFEITFAIKSYIVSFGRWFAL